MNKLTNFIKRNKLFLKILSSFLSLLIPIIIIGTFTYVNFVDQLRSDYNREIMSNIMIASDTNDNRLSKIHEVGISFFSDPTVIKLLKPNSYYTKEDRADLHELPNNIRRARFPLDPLVDEVFAYADTENVFDFSGINNFDSFFQSFYRYDHYDKDFWASKLTSPDYVEVLTPDHIQTRFVRHEVLTFIFNGKMTNSQAVLVITVPVQHLLDSIKHMLESNGSKAMITNGEGQVIALSDSEFSNEASIARIDKAIPEATGQGLIKLDDGQMYTATKANAAIYNWTYYVVKPVGEFRTKASDILTLIVIICILLIVVGCLFSFIFAYKIYKPITKIGQILTEQQKDSDFDGDGDGNPSLVMNDFNQIGAGVHQLIDYQKQYELDLQKLTDEYLSHSFLGIMKGDGNSIPGEEQLLDIMRNKLGFDQDAYRCCAIAFSFTKKFYEEIQDVDRILIKSKIKVLITGFFDKEANVFVMERDKFHYLCISNVSSQDSYDPFTRGLNMLIETFSNDYQYCNIHVGVGEAYVGLSGISLSHSNAMSALQSISQEEAFKIVYADTLQVKHNYQFSKTDESKLINVLNLGTKDDLKVFLEELLKRNEHVSFQLRNTLIGEIVEVGMRHAFENELEIKQFLTHQQQQELKLPSDLPIQLENRTKLLMIFLYDVMDYISEIRQRLSKSDVLANMIKQYVEDHYCQDLGLETIAESMNVSVKYVSRIFKDKFRVNLTDYISQLRINHSKKLLENKELTVLQVSEMSGFYNRTTFLRTFKRVEGVSPNDYRKSLLDKQEEENEV